MSRVDGPLRAADGAAVVDTTGLTVDEVVDLIVELLRASDRRTDVDRQVRTTFHAPVETVLRGRPAAARTPSPAPFVAGFARLWTRLRIEGREHIPATGAFVLAPVHRSNMDTPIASCLTRRRLRFMGKDSLWKRRPAAWFLSSLGGFPVSRGTADREALQRCIAVLEAGEPLVLFPEGERKSGPIVQPLFDGAAYVALKAGVPIVPVGIGGSERVMPKGARFIHPRKVHVIVGAADHAARRRTAAACRARVVREVTAELHATLQQLFDDAQNAASRLSRQVGRQGARRAQPGRRRRTPRAPSASTAAGRRRRRWRCRAGSR